MPRLCENCGMRMPAFKPRKKGPDGKMWCPNCHDGRPGRPRAEGSLEAESGRVEDWLIDHLPRGAPMAPGACERCRGRGRIMGAKSSMTCPRCKGTGRLAVKLAHDSGDGETIYHCPFCGGGQVVGRSDGTVECDFCQTAFTVQVQPQKSAQPQTAPDGTPLDMPGMPGDPTQREAPPADADAEFATLTGEAPGGPPGQGGAPPAPGTGGPPKPDDSPIPGAPPKKNPVPPQFRRGSRYYLTPDGVPLEEGTYMRHLALRFADDRDAVLADVRSENGSGPRRPS